MPKGMTPKKRMIKTTMSLARNLKPSGRLNADDIKRAGKARKEMSLSEIRDAKKLGKGVRSIGSMMSQGMSALAAKNLMKKYANTMSKKVSDVIKRQEKTKRPGSRPNKNPKTKTPSSRPSDRRPMGTKALGPLRPIRERSKISRLVRSNTRKPKR